MKNILSLIALFLTVSSQAFCAGDKAGTKADSISFYSVPLVCGAAPNIGCGSRIKPLFMDTEKEKLIKASWANRQGTVIAIAWNETELSERDREKLIKKLFKAHDIGAKLISDDAEKRELLESMNTENAWYKGMDVDKLSMEEAGVIAESLTGFAVEKSLITAEEKDLIKKDLTEYFTRQLTKVRTPEELNSEESDAQTRQDCMAIYVKHIGQERAEKVAAYYDSLQGQGEEQESSGK